MRPPGPVVVAGLPDVSRNGILYRRLVVLQKPPVRLTPLDSEIDGALTKAVRGRITKEFVAMLFDPFGGDISKEADARSEDRPIFGDVRTFQLKG